MVVRAEFQKYCFQMDFNMSSLSDKIKDQIAEMPECSYGVNKVTVVLDDGTEFRDVYVAWGEEIIKVGNSKTIPFDPGKVVRVKE